MIEPGPSDCKNAALVCDQVLPNEAFNNKETS